MALFRREFSMPESVSYLTHPLVQASLAGFVTALAVLMAQAGGTRFLRRSPRRTLPDGGKLVFEGRYLIASEGAVREDFARSAAEGDDWDCAVALLAGDFPTLDGRFPPVALDVPWITSADGARRMEVSRKDGVVTLSFQRTSTCELVEEENDIERGELSSLRAIARTVPFPMWIQNARGHVVWVNKTYMDMAREAFPESEDGGWPPPDLFDQAALPRPDRPDEGVRLPFRRFGSDHRHWYEVSARALGASRVFSATCVDATVRAERQLSDFSQTLTKTFAHLTIGLAIFDQERRLMLFNPALADLTGLSPGFLSSQPSLVGVLDGLRERRIIPEPKDYISWRRKMSELEAAALDGSYEETWSLPTGQTYRVTGRPHPDGAVIFLFEDITAEISLTRRFRSELEIGQSVINSLDEALAVFSADGTLAMTNAEYATLWGHDPETQLSGLSVNEITCTWLERTIPTPAWGDFRDFARQSHDRAEWSADVIMKDGRSILCRFVPLAGGATLAGFQHRTAGELKAEKLQRQSA